MFLKFLCSPKTSASFTCENFKELNSWAGKSDESRSAHSRKLSERADSFLEQLLDLSSVEVNVHVLSFGKYFVFKNKPGPQNNFLRYPENDDFDRLFFLKLLFSLL